MAETSKELSQEYWRPAPTAGHQLQAYGFQTHSTESFCTTCGTRYAAGARFCHVCGLNREDDLRADDHRSLLNTMVIENLKQEFGLSTVSLVLVGVAAVFMLAGALTGLVYNTATMAEWQAVQTWRIEWLLASVAALLAAVVFRSKAQS